MHKSFVQPQNWIFTNHLSIKKISLISLGYLSKPELHYITLFL